MQDTVKSINATTDEKSVKDLCIVNSHFKKHEDTILKIVRESGAILQGHFQLLSGLHSEYFLRFSKISANSQNVEFISNIIAEKLEEDLSGQERDSFKILSPDTAGVTLAYELSKKLSLKRISVKTDSRKRPTHLINHLDLEYDDQVILVNDLSSTFSGIERMMDLTLSKKANIFAIVLFASRTLTLQAFPENIKTYIIADFFKNTPSYGKITKKNEVYLVEDCPMCTADPNVNNVVPSWELN